MKQNVYVVLFDVDYTDNGIELAKKIENKTHIINKTNGDNTNKKLLQILHKELNTDDGITVMSLSDFTHNFNNEEINDTQYWISYVNVIFV